MKKKIFASVVIFSLLVSLLTACHVNVKKSQSNAVSFTDSCGRTVSLPETIRSVIPLGKTAQMVLYSLCPEKLLSLSSAPSGTEKKYILPTCRDLPVTGQMYGGKTTLNPEQIIALAPDVLIDVGSNRASVREDLDELQRKTGIPCVFLELKLDTMQNIYRTLGELLDESARANDCAAYIETVFSAVRQTDHSPASFLYISGINGTEAIGSGSVHAEAFAVLGLTNAADFGNGSSKGERKVSPEQILLWDPDLIFYTDDTDLPGMIAEGKWSKLKAVKNEAYYRIPSEPVNWLDNPPSVQRALGLIWIMHCIEPEKCVFDFEKTVKEYFDIFYHYPLKTEEMYAIVYNEKP